jgi:galactonate dehydratase
MLLSRRHLLALPASAGFAAPAPCKITRFVIHKSTLRWRDLVFLEIHTDSGLVGLGEATLETRADLAEAALRWLEPTMVGQDPQGPEQHWNRNYYGLSRWRHGAAELTALSAVDIALWDLEGKRLGVPVSRLLGGAIHNPLPLYFTHWSSTLKERTPAAFSEWATETRRRGWRAVKWTVHLAGDDKSRIAQIVNEVQAVRVAVGSQLEIGLELAETFNYRTTLELARALAPLKPMFLEEPTLRENPALLGQLAAQSPVPIATGEGLLLRSEIRQLLEHKGAAIVQPDVLHAGGITELRKIAQLAETFGVEIAPHQCSGPVGHVASLHAMAGCRNFFLQEWEGDDDAVYQELCQGTYPVQKDGAVSLPTGPGLGLTVNFAELTRRFPYKGINRRATLTK